MSSIPHDYYLKFTDPSVYEDILNFHNKGNYCIHDATRHSTVLHNLSGDQLSSMTGHELRIFPDMESTLSEGIIPHEQSSSTLYRNNSCSFFSNQPVEFSEVTRLLAPLTTKNETLYNRGYPSGGALYPIEVFCCHLENPASSWPSNQSAHHILLQSRTFEPLRNSASVEYLRKATLGNSAELGTPQIALIYAAYLPKNIFKYRYRGYRLALLEAGSMYMLIDLQCKEMQMQNRIWSGYNDHMIAQALTLNPALFLPLCVQLIGH